MSRLGHGFAAVQQDHLLACYAELAMLSFIRAYGAQVFLVLSQPAFMWDYDLQSWPWKVLTYFNFRNPIVNQGAQQGRTGGSPACLLSHGPCWISCHARRLRLLLGRALHSCRMPCHLPGDLRLGRVVVSDGPFLLRLVSCCMPPARYCKLCLAFLQQLHWDAFWLAACGTLTQARAYR